MAGVPCHPWPTGDPIHLRNAFSELGWGQRPAHVHVVSLRLSFFIWEGSPLLLMSFVEGPFVWGIFPLSASGSPVGLGMTSFHCLLEKRGFLLLTCLLLGYPLPPPTKIVTEVTRPLRAHSMTARSICTPVFFSSLSTQGPSPS